VLIAVVLLLPGGIVPAVRSAVVRFVPALGGPPGAAARTRRRARRPAPPLRPRGDRAQAERLSADGLSKVFGGLTAVDGVSATFTERGVHSLIGPNGAGKSTFFNLLVGRYPPTMDA
jgi:branched-chain amino acid transport system permease protein